jgi:uncharacterized phiE125 gp8 family phage protein
MTEQPLLTLVSAPAVEPITTTEAKLYLRVSTTSEDALIGGFITSARVWIESYTRRALITQTWDQRFAAFPQYRDPLVLSKAPVQSVSGVTYIDADGTTQTLNTSYYAVRTASGPTAGRGYLETTALMSEPSTDTTVTHPVIVRTVCGYGNAASVPPGIVSALYLLLGDLYEQRQETIVGTISGKTQTTVERLLGPYRLVEAV